MVFIIAICVGAYFRISRVTGDSDRKWQEDQERQDRRYEESRQATASLQSEGAKFRAEMLKVATDYCTNYKAMSPAEQKSGKADALKFAEQLIDTTARQTVIDCVDPASKP